MKWKQTLALVLSAATLLGTLAGCGKQEEAPQEVANVAASTGRYVEQPITLPDSFMAHDMVTLQDGRIRVALETEEGGLIATSSGGEQWEDVMPLPQEILGDHVLESVALSPDGTVFCSTMEYLEDNTSQPHLWVIDPDGTHRELPNTYEKVDPEMGFFIQNADFTQDGRLMVSVYIEELRQLDTATGEFGPNLNEMESMLFRMGCGGNSTYMMDMDTASVYADGETQLLPEALKAHIEESLKKDYGNTPKMVFWENQDGYLFYTTSEGLYSYVPGGGVVEELVSAARTAMGDPTFVPMSLTGGQDGSFYLLANRQAGPALYRYRYDQNAPSTAPTNLRIYSLYEDSDLQQMIAQFQGAHPEITVDLEIGLNGQDGRTQADAIAALNTEILAGTGPDILCLDGLNADTYLEKGVLADLSNVLAQAGQTLEQVTKCYAQGGQVCAIPTTFALPAMYGAETYLSQIHDLNSLVAAAQQARADHPEEPFVVNSLHPKLLGDIFYDSCSPAWLREDGTLDEEKLTEFYTAMQALYALDTDARAGYADAIAQMDAEIDTVRPAGAYTGMDGVRAIHMGQAYLPAGTLEGMEHWSLVLAGEKEYLGDGYTTIHLDGQASHVFLPRRIMAILATSDNIPAAESFLAYMLSDEVQSQNLSTGFPVNQTVFDRQIAEDQVSDTTMGISTVNGEVLEFTGHWPEAELRQQLKTWVEGLTTPALTDRTIRQIVMTHLADCCNGQTTPAQAAQNALKELNLYLSE